MFSVLNDWTSIDTETNAEKDENCWRQEHRTGHHWFYPSRLLHQVAVCWGIKHWCTGLWWPLTCVGCAFMFLLFVFVHCHLQPPPQYTHRYYMTSPRQGFYSNKSNLSCLFLYELFQTRSRKCWSSLWLTEEEQRTCVGSSARAWVSVRWMLIENPASWSYEGMIHCLVATPHPPNPLWKRDKVEDERNSYWDTVYGSFCFVLFFSKLPRPHWVFFSEYLTVSSFQVLQPGDTSMFPFCQLFWMSKCVCLHVAVYPDRHK